MEMIKTKGPQMRPPANDAARDSEKRLMSIRRPKHDENPEGGVEAEEDTEEEEEEGGSAEESGFSDRGEERQQERRR